jgi:hypothetical protein
MRFTTRGRLVVAATGLLAALAIGLPSQAEPSPEPVVEFATATCSGSGELNVEFLLTDPIGTPAHPEYTYVVAGTHVSTGPESAPVHDSELAGTLIPGAEVPPPGEGSLSGMTVVPGDATHVTLEVEIDRTSADGTERIAAEGEARLKACEPVVPEQALEHEHGPEQATEQATENPGRVWGPYGGKRTIPTHQDPSGGQTPTRASCGCPAVGTATSTGWRTRPTPAATPPGRTRTSPLPTTASPGSCPPA